MENQKQESFLMEHSVSFAEWLRKNFNNSPDEVINCWEDVYYRIDNYRIMHYTTIELYEWWLKNKTTDGELL